jgi:hypothetical protein
MKKATWFRQLRLSRIRAKFAKERKQFLILRRAEMNLNKNLQDF